jgi:hypothetical protein
MRQYYRVRKGNGEESEAAMEQMKILNLDFGRERTDKKTLVSDAIRMISEKVRVQYREEVNRIMKGTRVCILGNYTSTKEVEKE